MTDAPKETAYEPRQKSPRKPIGPIVGIIIVMLLLLGGALYFFSYRYNELRQARNQIPYIPAGTTTIIVNQTASAGAN